MEILLDKGAVVDYNDPHVPVLPEMRHYDIKKESIELTADNLKSFDCVLISTDHSAYDWEFIAEHAHLIVDTRNAMTHISKNREKIVKA